MTRRERLEELAERFRDAAAPGRMALQVRRGAISLGRKLKSFSVTSRDARRAELAGIARRLRARIGNRDWAELASGWRPVGGARIALEERLKDAAGRGRLRHAARKYLTADELRPGRYEAFRRQVGEATTPDKVGLLAVNRNNPTEMMLVVNKLEALLIYQAKLRAEAELRRVEPYGLRNTAARRAASDARIERGAIRKEIGVAKEIDGVKMFLAEGYGLLSKAGKEGVPTANAVLEESRKRAKAALEQHLGVAEKARALEEGLQASAHEARELGRLWNRPAGAAKARKDRALRGMGSAARREIVDLALAHVHAGGQVMRALVE